MLGRPNFNPPSNLSVRHICTARRPHPVDGATYSDLGHATVDSVAPSLRQRAPACATVIHGSAPLGTTKHLHRRDTDSRHCLVSGQADDAH
jgi:hypothetical protein